MSDLAIAAGADATPRIDHVRRAAPDDRAATLHVASPATAAAAAADSVEISERARLLSRLRELPAVRADLVQQVRTAVADGAYDAFLLSDDTLDRIADDARLFG